MSLTLDGMTETELEGGWYLVEEISRALTSRPVPEKAKADHQHHRLATPARQEAVRSGSH
ncbi:MAG: hypothetical protein WBQ21_02910 [Solirubrobacteraceae bacterium]